MDVNVLKDQANKKLQSLMHDLNESFKSLAKKENTTQSNIQLCIRYNPTVLNNSLIDRVKFYAKKFGVEETKVQLAIRFMDQENGDAKLYQQVFNNWQPVETKNFLGEPEALEDYIVNMLPKTLKEENIDFERKWSNVSCIFYLKDERLAMGIFVVAQGKMTCRKRIDFANETIKHRNFVYFQVLKEMKFLRNANFSKDFLNMGSIMPDLMGREEMVRGYLAGGEFEIPVIKERIAIPGQMDSVLSKYNIPWGKQAFIFKKENDQAQPVLGIYEVMEDGSFELKHSINDLLESAQEGISSMGEGLENVTTN